MREELAWFLCQGLAVLAIAILVSFCLRGKTSGFLRRFWCGVWLALALLPVATQVLPKWSLALPAVEENSFTEPVPIALEGETLPSMADFSLPLVRERPVVVAPKRSWVEMLVIAWGAVASLLLLRLIVSQMLLCRLRLGSREAPELWKESLLKQSIPSSAKLRMSARTRVPMTWGLIRPVIMIPKDYENHAPAERAFVLRHECQHLRQQDTRWLVLAQTMLCLHWINPFAWLAMKRLRLAQEKSCDEAVVHSEETAVAYADFLLRAAKRSDRSFFRPLALAVVPSRQTALKQRLTNILTPTMKTNSSKRLNASLIAVVTAVCLTLATLGLRTPTEAHEVSDPDLQQKLDGKMMESVELNRESVKGTIAYLKAPLKELEVNVVLLRGAQQAMEEDHRDLMVLDHMIAVQKDVVEEARLKMLDIMERYRITQSDSEMNATSLMQSEANVLAKEMAIATDKMRIEALAGLESEPLIRLISEELPDNPFLDSAVKDYINAKGGNGKSPVLERSRVAIAEEVKNVRNSLNTKLQMAERELALAKDIAEGKKDTMMDYERKVAEYDSSRRDYDRQLAALEGLEQRQLDARLKGAQQLVQKVTLSLTDTSLADTMTYALQLAGLDYRLRKNTVVIGTLTELESL